MFRKPFCKVLHDRLWLLEAQMLLASEAAHSQGFRDKLLRNRASSPVEGLIEQFFENHCSEAHHRELCRNRPIRFDIHNDVAHFVPEDWALNRYYSFSTSYARWLFVTPTESGPVTKQTVTLKTPPRGILSGIGIFAANFTRPPFAREFTLLWGVGGSRGSQRNSRGNGSKTGAPGEIRTPDLLLRRQPLYPAELRAHGSGQQFTWVREQAANPEGMVTHHP